MIKGIRHIIFDLGAVLLNIDYLRTENAFIDLGITNFAEMYSKLKQSTLFDDFEVGAIDRQEFLDSLQRSSGIELEHDTMTNAWNAMLLDFPLRRLQLLQQLRLYHDLVLLSNTNEIHEEAFNKIIYSAHGIPSLAVMFDKVYLSHRIGMRKPHPEVFQRILDENGFEAQHTLFIDDSPQHVEGAKSVGIQAIWLEPGMTIEEHIFKPLN